jgi:hypothetical protein
MPILTPWQAHARTDLPDMSLLKLHHEFPPVGGTCRNRRVC